MHESPDSSSGSYTQDEGYEEKKLFKNSLLSLNDYRSQLLQIAIQHSLSDRALKSVHCIVAQCMPASNNLPSFNSIQTYQSNLLNSVSKTICSNGVCLTLNIKPLLSKVIEENLHILDQRKNWIPEKFLKLPSVSNDSVKTIYLIINTDGISVPSKPCKHRPVNHVNTNSTLFGFKLRIYHVRFDRNIKTIYWRPCSEELESQIGMFSCIV